MKIPWWNLAKCTWWWRKWPQNIPSFLMLHSVSDDVVDSECPNNTIRPAELEQLIVALCDKGYRFRKFSEAIERSADKSVVLTFDDGFVDNYRILFPIVKRLHVPVTCFVTNRGDSSGRWKDYCRERVGLSADKPENFLSPDMIEEMHNSGLVEFGGHTACHISLTEQSIDDARRDINDNKIWIEDIIGERIASFCYPRGRYNDAIIELVKEAGYKYAATMEKKMRLVEAEPYRIHRQIIPRGLETWQSYLLATRGKFKI